MASLDKGTGFPRPERLVDESVPIGQPGPADLSLELSGQGRGPGVGAKHADIGPHRKPLWECWSWSRPPHSSPRHPAPVLGFHSAPSMSHLGGASPAVTALATPQPECLGVWVAPAPPASGAHCEGSLPPTILSCVTFSLTSPASHAMWSQALCPPPS